ncbi:uncharacterized protein C8R40DRAFT_1165908 [Lentinula edodes]|uniref:uncharacterized protein n=1 Tax=Lentinula edodes TaxID=5353 RepID=UPI001E8D8B59|nr:uncharacterized protein C8R40DRAFT_1165908 [Lentinula edodes]KAH7879657.1 hypothetical protein C8R40DRAFT_1165908 [Lentinula edodes]
MSFVIHATASFLQVCQNLIDAFYLIGWAEDIITGGDMRGVRDDRDECGCLNRLQRHGVVTDTTDVLTIVDVQTEDTAQACEVTPIDEDSGITIRLDEYNLSSKAARMSSGYCEKIALISRDEEDSAPKTMNQFNAAIPPALAPLQYMDQDIIQGRNAATPA